MCAGQLTITEGSSVCTCDFCGTEQTIPKVADENIQNLFNRANNLRMKAEFDKAAEIYEKILQSDGTEAEGYWGLILCKYGIEYVEDPVSLKRIPTCHRASFDAVTADDDYKMALQYADIGRRSVYESEAKQIEEIQKGILSLVQKEEPYDVFICYKESDENGKRTPDSVIANDIYYQLTQEGYKVFYAAITLEDKLGQEYEPYIFSALNSARVMLSIGTKPEYFEAVWVKNEWSRFLKIMKKDRARMLIPCYKDMDAYDLPEDFAHLQAQDMTKIGFINDLVRGIKKVIVKDDEQSSKAANSNVVVQQVTGSNNSNALIKRGNMALEDGEWQKADDFFEEVLNQDAECAEAYLGKFMSKCECENISALTKKYISEYDLKAETKSIEACAENSSRIEQSVTEYEVKGYLDSSEIRELYVFDRTYMSELASRKQQKNKELLELADEKLFERAKQYATGETKSIIDKFIADITAVLDNRIFAAEQQDKESIESIKSSYEKHLSDADAKVQELHNKALERQETAYISRVQQMESAKTINDYEIVRDLFKSMDGYKDTLALAEQCQTVIDGLKEEERLATERKEAARKAEAAQRAKKRKIITAIVFALVAICIAVIIVVVKVVIPNNNYNKAIALMDRGSYHDAIQAFEEMNGYKDSDAQIIECNYMIALDVMNKGEYEAAIQKFTDLSGYKDSQKNIDECSYLIANRLLESGDYENAMTSFKELGDYKDSSTKYDDIQTQIYDNAMNSVELGLYDEAKDYLMTIPEYSKTQYGMDYITYCIACDYMDSGDLKEAANYFTELVECTDISLFEGAEEKMDSCLKGVAYEEAYDECKFYVKNSGDVASAYARINNVLQMERGAADDCTEALNIELQYLDLFSAYAGSYHYRNDYWNKWYDAEFSISLNGVLTSVWFYGDYFYWDGNKLSSGDDYLIISNGNTVKFKKTTWTKV